MVYEIELHFRAQALIPLPKPIGYTGADPYKMCAMKFFYVALLFRFCCSIIFLKQNEICVDSCFYRFPSC